MKVCFAEQMREIDRAASEKGGIPSIILMENAAVACVDELKKDFGDLSKKSVAVFCGKGNNGGDGFAIARHLSALGADTAVFLVCGNDFTGDAKVNYDIIRKMDINIDVISDTENLKYIIKSFDIAVDAIFGTGIHGTITGIAGAVIEEINENAKYVLSVDIPSGINADSGEICGVCIKADKTVTFAAYKAGMLMFPGADYVGDTVTADISIPQYIIEDANIGTNIIDESFVKKSIPERANNSHKGDNGKLLIIAGSRGKTGAAYMASQAALKSGIGLVTVGICESLNNVMENKTTEAMTLPLPDDNGILSEEAAGIIKECLNSYDAVLIGPGLGKGRGVTEVVRTVLVNSKNPVIVDADAINTLAENMDILSECSCDLIFTPHTAEMSRLTGLEIEYIETNRLVVSKEFSEEYGAVLILKGHHTVVTAPDLVQYINITGNPGLAKGGSGDVLAGITAALAAKGIEAAAAAAAAVYIHGAAADKAAETISMESMTAAEVIGCISPVMKRITGR